jgi:hypothetical protein
MSVPTYGTLRSKNNSKPFCVSNSEKINIPENITIEDRISNNLTNFLSVLTSKNELLSKPINGINLLMISWENTHFLKCHMLMMH